MDMSQPNMRGSHLPVIVVGGGQAGLAMSWCLKHNGIEHLVFEKHRLAHEWRTRRWDSFCLVTPNWQCALPGFSYADYGGTDPHGFMVREEIVAYIEAYAASFQPPLREGVAVRSVRRGPGGVFEVGTSDGEYTADQVVIAIGGYHVPTVPRIAERLPEHVLQIHSVDYRNAAQLPAGEVLVVGSGQSGAQIAEDLHLAGRKVHLCVGSAPRTARFYRGRDVVDWLADMGYYDMPVHEHPLKERVRAKANHYVTGRDGGRDIDLRRFAKEGMQLHGRLQDVRGGRFHFGDDLKHNLDNADAVSESIKTSIDKYIAAQGIAAPEEARYVPVWQPGEPLRELDVAASGITSVIWSNGFRPDWGWIEMPVFDGKGYPSHRRGVTAQPGLYFLGLPWQYTWGSGRFSGVGDDARHLAGHVQRRIDEQAEAARTVRVGLNEWALGS
ncbi:MAG: MSMEG_0569 family flavin-dependent oxidoreductase [Aquabacterium sp.]|jgi:putative flavoprotein involved in K+ transport|nr:MAG: MSMEG_0569 family flavin-dependent oxidoreductase [Aquabacterium sp.]